MNTPYQYPNGVLENLLGIQDAAALTQAEASLTAVRIALLLRTPLSGPFDLPHLQAIHRFMFQDVYAWAGEIRTIDIGKGAGQFAHHAYIVPQANQLFTQLAGESHLRQLDTVSFARIILAN